MNKNEEKTKKLPLGKFGPMGKGRGIEKPKNFKQSLKKLMAVLKPYLPAIIISLVLAIVSTIFVIVGPNKLKEITDIIGEGMFTGINLEKIGKIGIFLVSI
ncbi:MAG: ABC transporter ATP-binding protein, partial [Clostridia bacterium]